MLLVEGGHHTIASAIYGAPRGRIIYYTLGAIYTVRGRLCSLVHTHQKNQVYI